MYTDNQLSHVSTHNPHYGDPTSHNLPSGTSSEGFDIMLSSTVSSRDNYANAGSSPLFPETTVQILLSRIQAQQNILLQGSKFDPLSVNAPADMQIGKSPP